MRHITLAEIKELKSSEEIFTQKSAAEQQKHVHKMEKVFLFSPGMGLLNRRFYEVCWGCGKMEDSSSTKTVAKNQ